ncbi:minor tail protein [Erwinia phage vB_EamM_Desertfox]|uniref:Glycine-rich domain-containing protein n=5 Tax=Agricanvirus TaxID=1984776 RepID=A0A482IKA6_9CAUD|nr:minor tail protein [Erwinia phage vB_EamM_Deimos-Minion]YP_009621853.1 minor tail protein [Erwinia phage vB_EamM_Desertfox]AUG85900.1 hypothetical protein BOSOLAPHORUS_113 [Erwinia phage vB_EamM_Bosolaphorus]AUG86541.1 hypothetical protein MADMEL_113 [Erwinia phage vB_EamM_MadMel]QBP07220.1 hypothetical protein REBECCA_113 [Erwinia phage Rebecca]ANH52215.1 hypothetical protein DM_117 [Erwinia phage vB_EamM_Deimos-Minion]AUG86219.1 hypothetical protein DESERTFOX_112 [Erwinia phage vB_EamM_D
MFEMLFCGKPASVGGQQLFTTAGTFSFVVPAGITELDAYTQGGGGGGGNGNPGVYKGASGGSGKVGANGYLNNISVTPGETLTVIVGAAGAALKAGEATQLLRGSNVLLAVAGGAAGVTATGTSSSENNLGTSGTAAPTIPGNTTTYPAANKRPGSGGNGGAGRYNGGGGIVTGPGIAGGCRLMWGKDRDYPSTGVADVKM